MNTLETLEGNKLIAEFMDVTRIENGSYDLPQFGRVFAGNYKTEYIAQELKYHVSWDWLMPVVNKIENTLIDEDYPMVIISGDTCEIECPEFARDMKTWKDGEKQSSTYWMVLRFIEWYNENKEEL